MCCLSSLVQDGTELSIFSWYVHVSFQFIAGFDILSATSTDVGCVFSKGWLVLSHIRNQLSVASNRALMCLGAWSKLGFVRDADLRAAQAFRTL